MTAISNIWHVRGQTAYAIEDAPYVS